jgi:hypothetical protein
MTPLQIAQQAFYLTLINAGVAVVAFSVVTFLLLRIANLLSGIHFETSYKMISQDNRALALYLSVRYAVLGLGNAMILSAIFMYR